MKKSTGRIGMMKRTKSNEMRGFSIIELAVVIVVLGILTAIVYVSYNSIVKANDEEALKAAVQTAGSSIDTYKSNNGVYPTAAAFNAMTIQGVGDDISLRYVPDVIRGAFCLDATMRDMTVRLSSDQRRPVEGACPAAAPGGIDEEVINLALDPNMTTLTGKTAVGISGTPTIQTSPDPRVGSSFARLTATASGSGGLATSVCKEGSWTSFDDDVRYTVSVWMRPSVTRAMQVVFNWREPGFPGYMRTDTSTPVSVPAGQWTRLTLSSISAGTQCIDIHTRTAVESPLSVGDYIDVDAMMLTRGEKVYDFEDGASADWVWNGTPNASSSTGPARYY